MSEMSPRLRAELVILRNNWMRDVEFFHDFPESLVLALSLKKTTNVSAERIDFRKRRLHGQIFYDP